MVENRGEPVQITCRTTVLTSAALIASTCARHSSGESIKSPRSYCYGEILRKGLRERE